MRPYISRDNDMATNAFATVYLVTPTFLEAWGAATAPDRATLTIVDRRGRTRDVTLAAGPVRRTPRRLTPPIGAAAPLPVYLRDVNTPYVLTTSIASRTAYLQFNQVTDMPVRSLAAFATVLGDSLRAVGAERLIVDVRHNNGGNNLILAPLVETITKFANASSSHRVYVLTGRATFSAAQNFINRIEQRVPQAIFAGEPSMSSPNFTGEDNAVPLRFSQLVVSISNRYWQDSRPDDRRPWIAPTIPVTLTSADWLANRDPVMDAVLRDSQRPSSRWPCVRASSAGGSV